jgi:hypothetical protein
LIFHFHFDFHYVFSFWFSCWFWFSFWFFLFNVLSICSQSLKLPHLSIDTQSLNWHSASQTSLTSQLLFTSQSKNN